MQALLSTYPTSPKLSKQPLFDQSEFLWAHKLFRSKSLKEDARPAVIVLCSRLADRWRSVLTLRRDLLCPSTLSLFFRGGFSCVMRPTWRCLSWQAANPCRTLWSSSTWAPLRRHITPPWLDLGKRGLSWRSWEKRGMTFDHKKNSSRKIIIK